MSRFPRFPNRVVQCLDGMWDFTFLGTDIALGRSYAELVPNKLQDRPTDNPSEKTSGRAAVPGCFDTIPSHAGVRGTAVYTLTVSIAPGRQALLRFGGVGLWVRVYVDGETLFEGSYPYSPLAVEVPASDSERRTLAVLIDNRFDAERVPLFEPFFDFYAYGGIYRSVELHELPDKYIDRLEVTPIDVYAGRICVAAFLGRTTAESVPGTVTFDDGSRSNVTFTRSDGAYVAEAEVPEPRPWSPEDPQLHRLRVEIGEDSIEERFGLRTVEATGGHVLVNGRAVKLLGVCRHEAHPQFGPALPLQQLVQDLDLIRGLGCNFVRGVHYPQDQRFLELCDEQGILVFEETLGWGQRESRFFASRQFYDGQVLQMRRMIAASYNHPSVISWGFLNEGGSNEEFAVPLYRELIGLAKSLDGSRPVTYASMFPFDDLLFEEADIISVNQYPAWYSGDGTRPLETIPERLERMTAHLAASGLSDKPVVVSEIGAGAIYGWRDSHHSRWSEEYQRDHLSVVCREILSRSAYAGVSLWQFCDCRTYDDANAIKRPRAFNNKGLFDEYRRPKLAADAVGEIFRGRVD